MVASSRTDDNLGDRQPVGVGIASRLLVMVKETASAFKHPVVEIVNRRLVLPRVRPDRYRTVMVTPLAY